MAKSKIKLITGTDLISKPQEKISISPNFDAAVGKVSLGDIGILGGITKGGKSLEAIQIISKFLKQYPESECLYWDVEHRLKEYQLSNHLLDKDRIRIMRSSEDHIISAEEGLTEVENFLKENKRCIVCIDSTSALATSGELAEEVKGNYRTTTPKLLAMFYRRAMSIVPAREHVLINLVHLIDNMSGYGGPLLDSGKAMQFATNFNLITRKKELWKDDDDKVIGIKTFWNVNWASNSTPGGEFVTYNRFNFGVDEIMEQIELGIEMALIGKTGGWYELDYLENYKDDEKVQEFYKLLGKTGKINGQAEVYKLLTTNPYISDLLSQELDKMLE